MIGRAAWFERRKYGGWGIAPKTKEGWIYIILVIVPFIIFQALPQWSQEVRLWVTGGWLAFLFLDVGHIMLTLHRDERESKIEAFAERNAAWFMMLVLVAGVLYDAYRTMQTGQVHVNYFIMVALIGGALVKTISNVVMDRKGV